ncbi:MAG: NAD(P)H-binding protein [Polyangiaceae bacterium]|nr:NAD(P)H-binding protein [Polyangiaceae bacterium]
MKVLLFGATGMVGQGVLRECLLDPAVEQVLTVGRSEVGIQHAKLRQIVHADLMDLSPIASQLEGLDACFFCLGISAAGMTEEAYRRVTYDYAMSVATTLVERSPSMTFIFVSGIGTDNTGKSRMMWARVKGETENAIAKLPFSGTYMFRPGFIQPQHGIRSRTTAYRLFYAVLSPLYPLLRALLPRHVTSTEGVGRAMLEVARNGAPKQILETADINLAASSAVPQRDRALT